MSGLCRAQRPLWVSLISPSSALPTLLPDLRVPFLPPPQGHQLTPIIHHFPLCLQETSQKQHHPASSFQDRAPQARPPPFLTQHRVDRNVWVLLITRTLEQGRCPTQCAAFMKETPRREQGFPAPAPLWPQLWACVGEMAAARLQLTQRGGPNGRAGQGSLFWPQDL